MRLHVASDGITRNGAPATSGDLRRTASALWRLVTTAEHTAPPLPLFVEAGADTVTTGPTDLSDTELAWLAEHLYRAGNRKVLTAARNRRAGATV